MAINLFNKYGSRANPPSIDYPEGSIKNRSAPDVKDGTPLDADWANDHQGFFQSILSYFGVTANGTPDKVGASQYFDALMSDPTESRRGMPLKATNAEVQTGTNASKMVTPASLSSRTATESRTGLVELATNAEVAAGTDTTRAVTPAGLKSHLGTAATRNVGTSSGNVMAVGAFGLGSNAATITTPDAINLNTGFYEISEDAAWDHRPFHGWVRLIHINHGSPAGYATQYAFSFISNKVAVRTLFSGVWGAWDTMYHTGNLQLPLGQGQTWQGVNEYRVFGTTYTNTTRGSILVSVYTNSASDTYRSMEASVGGVNVGRWDTNGGHDGTITFLVPSGASYSVAATGLTLATTAFWRELR